MKITPKERKIIVTSNSMTNLFTPLTGSRIKDSKIGIDGLTTNLLPIVSLKQLLKMYLLIFLLKEI